jgi:hypothetical protein
MNTRPVNGLRRVHVPLINVGSMVFNLYEPDDQWGEVA